MDLKTRIACFFIFLIAMTPLMAATGTASVRPARIVSINLCADELLLRVADPGQIIAVTQYPKSPEAAEILKRFPAIRNVRGRAEEVLTLKPDLVLVGPFTQRETVAMIQNSGVAVFSVAVPKDFEGIYRNIGGLADRVGQSERGRTVIANMKKELAELGDDAAAHPVPRKVALFFQSEGIVPGRETFEHAILSAGGLADLGERMGIEEYGRLSLEKLIREKPDVLVFTGDQKNQPSVRGEILNHPAIHAAHPNLKTVVLPSCLLNCGSPSSVEAVRILRDAVRHS